MRPNNRFDRLPRLVQWLVAMGLMAAIFVPVLGVLFGPHLFLTDVIGVRPAIVLGYAAVLPFMWFFLPVIQAFGTPLMKLLGVYVYYSPLLMVALPRRDYLEVHGGTSWDIVWTISLADVGPKARYQLLLGYLDGLLAMIEQVELGTIAPDATIAGTSYFFEESTATRLGFDVQPASCFQRAFFWFALWDLSAMLSFTRGRLTLARVWEVKLASTTASRLVQNRPTIERMREVVERRLRG